MPFKLLCDLNCFDTLKHDEFYLYSVHLSNTPPKIFIVNFKDYLLINNHDDKYKHFISHNEDLKKISVEFKYNDVSATYIREKIPSERPDIMTFLVYIEFDDVENKDEFTKKFIFDCKMFNNKINNDKINIFVNIKGPNDMYWENESCISPRNMDTIYIDEKIKKGILNDLDRFNNTKSLCSEMGIKYKRTYLLYGPPGSGKSSMILAIATEMKRSLYRLQINETGISDTYLHMLIGSLHENAILVIEDVDSFFMQRESATNISFSSFINALDGVSANDGLLTIMTTNHKDRLESALLRSGRIDKVFEISGTSAKMVSSMMQKWLPFINISECNNLAKIFSERLYEKKLNMASMQSILLVVRYENITDVEKIKTRFNELIVNERGESDNGLII